MCVGTNECVGVGGCWGVLLLHIVCGLACVAFTQVPLSTISLIMVFAALCLNAVPGVSVAVLRQFFSFQIGSETSLPLKHFDLFLPLERESSCLRMSLAVPEGSDVTAPPVSPVGFNYSVRKSSPVNTIQQLQLQRPFIPGSPAARFWPCSQFGTN